MASNLALDLSVLKEDLGICDVASDAWLERRAAAVWARFEKYTARHLCVPPLQFVDDWRRLASPYIPNQPPVLAYRQLGSPFLRVCPVVSIDAITRNGQVGDPMAVRFEPTSGKLFSLNEAWPGGHDVSHELATGDIQITYTAGWEEMPADLSEALNSILSGMYQTRSATAAGMGGGTISSINVVDVGTVEMGSADSSYVTAAMKGGGGADPLIGPWAYLLEAYVDYRVQIGSPLIPVTELVGPGAESGGGGTTTIGAPAVVSVRATAGTPILVTETPFAFDPPSVNLGNHWDHATQSFAPLPGAYQVNVSLACTSTNSNADASLILKLNGNEYARSTASATSGNIMTATMALALVTLPGDVLTVTMVADRNDMVVLNPGSGLSILGRSPP